MKYLLHKLFGWQYVIVTWGYDNLVKRVHKTADGREYVKIWGSPRLLEDFTGRSFWMYK